jgi:protoporphyrinogen oxidase
VWIPVEALVSTAPINEICELLDVGRPCLDYRSLVLYNIELSEPPLLPYQWCYFGGRDVVFSRASVPALMSAQACPSGAGGLCVEVACQQGDESWRDAEKWTSRVCADLERTRSIRSRSAVRVVHIERVADAYPRYSLDYEQKLETAKRGLARFVNLTLAGRTGLFWYNNMDDSIANGRQLAGALAGPVEQAA